MIRALSIAAALALMPASMAMAQDVDRDPTSAEAVLEDAAETFEGRMEEFAERAEAIQEDDSLSDVEKGRAIQALWLEYQPDVMAFTQMVTVSTVSIVSEAMADVDVAAIVSEALAEADEAGAMGIAQAIAVGQGVLTNGAWASDDPEHQETYGLMADYVVGMAMDEAEADIDFSADADD